MEPNVDLTSKRTFARVREFGDQTIEGRLLFGRKVAKRIPWNHPPGPTKKSPQGMLLTGSKEERETKRFIEKFTDSNYCPCCGGPSFAWDKNTICSNCRQKDIDYSEKPWWLKKRKTR